MKTEKSKNLQNGLGFQRINIGIVEKKGAFKLQLFVFSPEDKIVFKFRLVLCWQKKI